MGKVDEGHGKEAALMRKSDLIFVLAAIGGTCFAAFGEWIFPGTLNIVNKFLLGAMYCSVGACLAAGRDEAR